MGCASSKPSSSSSSKKKHDKSSPGKTTNDSGGGGGDVKVKNNNNNKSSSKNSPGVTTTTTNGNAQHLHESSNGVHEKSPLHLKQQVQAERARRLAAPLHVPAGLLHEIDQQRNRVITYLVTSVRRDLNSELIASGHGGGGGGGNKMAAAVMAAASANDNDDLITDVVSRAVLLILNGTAGNTYRVSFFHPSFNEFTYRQYNKI